MNSIKKMTPKERQKYILQTLKMKRQPLTGNMLAEKANVSRQVIVQDISILKAQNEPIVATSQGYLYIHSDPHNFEQTIAVHHAPEDTRKELYILVDHGITVKDVIVEHPVYGELTASLMVSSRLEVDQFLKKIKQSKASYLSELTDGIHLHTLIADKMDTIDAACQKLKEENLLLEQL